jgi:hypothetical protein
MVPLFTAELRRYFEHETLAARLAPSGLIAT